MPQSAAKTRSQMEQLLRVGAALSAETSLDRLLALILESAQDLTRADGGTLYLLRDQKLYFAQVRTRSLKIASGADHCAPFPPIELFDTRGEARHATVAAHCALEGAVINIPDIHQCSDFDFSGTFDYDKRTGYQSRSFLTVPMRNHEGDVIGVLQLINALDDQGEHSTFSENDQYLAEALASQAAVALTNRQLINDLRNLLERFIEAIAEAIDEKSAYTGNHCRRVPELAAMLADAVNMTNEGPLAAVSFSGAELYELRIAALLHDCGKITTPVHVVDKATKLETIFDRMALVETRYEILRRDAIISQLIENCSNTTANPGALDKALSDELDFLHRCNQGNEFMPESVQARIRDIAKRQWTNAKGESKSLLTDNEVKNLTISKGTINPAEREIINNHIKSTINMLEKLPFPKHLRNVPEIAGNHHERMDGKGYPRGLTRNQMSWRARIMGLVDIFEALTAADRPYKAPMKMSQALTILGKMTQEGHVDPDLFDVFVRQRVYKTFGKEFLTPEQSDPINLQSLPGFKN